MIRQLPTISALCNDFDMKPGTNLFIQGFINESFLRQIVGLSKRESASFLRTVKIYLKDNVSVLERLGCSTSEMASELGISQSTVYNYLRGNVIVILFLDYIYYIRKKRRIYRAWN